MRAAPIAVGVSGDTGDDDSDKAATSAALSLAGIEASPALLENSNLVLLVIGTAAPLTPELARQMPISFSGHHA
jgi:hypothetical protein